MHDILDEAVPWASAAAAVPPDEDLLEIGAQATDASRPAHFKQDKAAAARDAPTLIANLLKYGRHAALTACLFGAGWLTWSHLDRPAKIVIQPESARAAEMGTATQKVAEEPHTQKAELDALPGAQSQNTKDVTGLGGTKPPKTEISGAIAEVSGKVEQPPPESREKPSKPSERFDPIGHEITSLLAAAPVANRSTSAAVPRKRTKSEGGDAFDPSKNPTAPGAPRSLGTIAPAAATTNNSAAKIAYGKRADQ
jgi:hypothetical protein